MGQLISLTTQAARKKHRCGECGHFIQKGTTYVRQFVVDGGDAWTWKMHEDCADAAEYQFNQDGGDYGDGRTPLVDYESCVGDFPEWLRGMWPHVVCRLDYWRQIRN